MKLSEHSVDQRKDRIEYIDGRWRELWTLQSDAAKRAWTYLMVTNSGGAVAVLSFMGAMKSTSPFVHAPTMLQLFGIGAVLVGIGHAATYYRITLRFAKWRSSVGRFYRVLARDEN